MWPPRQVGLLSFGILVGVVMGVIGVRLLIGVPPPAGGSQTDANLDSLRAALEAEVEARTALTLEVDRLRQQLDRLATASELRAEVEARAVPPGEQGSAQAGTEPEKAVAKADSDELPTEERPAFDSEVLVGLGVHPHDAERLREHWQEFEMEKLELNHRSVREGWGFSSRHRLEQHALQSALREEIGDGSYDLLLYATGQPNRIVVREVLDRSPAREAGLEPGDTILSYNDTRVFRVSELRFATTLGEAGEYVRIDAVDFVQTGP